MKKKKRKVYFALFGALVLILCFFCYHLKNIYFLSKQEVYERIWNISLPDDLKEIYHMQTPVVFLPDGEKYTVFELQKEQMDLNGFYQGMVQKEFAEEILEILEVAKENRPDFSKGYIWKEYKKNSDTLLVLYFFEEKRLYFFQKLM